jgi:MscS family membrane protein
MVEIDQLGLAGAPTAFRISLSRTIWNDGVRMKASVSLLTSGRWRWLAGMLWVAVTMASVTPLARAQSPGADEPDSAAVEAVSPAQPGQQPLAPPDTSSPRATLQSFLTALSNAYNLLIADAEEEVIFHEARRAARCLDLSEVAPEFRVDVGLETALQLKEVMDRIGLPPIEEVPGAEEIKPADPQGQVLDKWSIPKTEITIARVTKGAKKGEYLFDAKTVAEAEEVFERVKALEYQNSETMTPYLYSEYLYTPGPWIKRKWTRTLPAWLQYPVYEQAVWQWLGLLVSLVLGYVLARLFYRAGRRWDRGRGREGVPSRGGKIVAIGSIILVTYAAGWLIHHQVRITGEVLQTTTTILSIVIFALIGWAAGTLFRSIGNRIIASRRLRPKGIDSQFVRLTYQLLTILVVVGLAFYLANRLGIPAYSLLTGLGVGGLAVALAARETLANFFGSLMIMMDRPFRVGDWIKVGDQEGTVEDIGFRSIRMRTFYNSVLSIPNAETVNVAVDNMGMRQFRRVRTVLQVTYDTPVERLESFVEGIKEIILAHPDTRKDYFHVVFNDFGAHSLDILVYFFLKVPDWAVELAARERIFIDIIRLAERLNVNFAFPTRTLHVDSLPTVPGATPADFPTEDPKRQFAPSSR